MANIKDTIRKIVRENFIKEMGKNDMHLKAIMKYYDKGTPSTKKQVAIVVSANKNANRGIAVALPQTEEEPVNESNDCGCK